MSDLRLAVRALRRSPLVSAVAVLSLALGIGANTAIFSIINALLLRPLPVADPQRLVTVSSAYALGYGFKAGAGMSYDMWQRLNQHLHMFDGGFAWSATRVNLSAGGEIQPADALFVSGGFFSTLGVQPLLGRALTAADDVRGGGPQGYVTVIGFGLWQRRFAGAASAIGSSLPIEGVAFTVVGVMPPDFFGVEIGQPFDVAIPLASEPALAGNRPSIHSPSAYVLTVMLRLGPAQSLESATTLLRTLQPQIIGTERRMPRFLDEPYVLVPAATGTSDRSGLRRRYSRPLLTLLAVVVCVLLVACVNIANLLLARAAARRQELSIRLALGASRWRLTRQLLVESLLLSTVGAVAGLIFALWASRAIVTTLATTDAQVQLDLSIDGRVLAVTAAALVATALLFGTGPAIRASRISPGEALGQHPRITGGRTTLFGGLVVAQIALCLVLIVAAGLFLTTFTRLAAVSLGFDRDRVLVVEIDMRRAETSRDAEEARLIQAVSALPGVARAAASTMTPFSRATKSPLFLQPGAVHEHGVTPEYFAVYGMNVRAGRGFDHRDTPTSERVAIVSEAYVRKFFPDGAALGRAIETGGACEPRRAGLCTVVGIVSDAIFGSVRAGANPTVFVPLTQSPRSGTAAATVNLSIRTASGSPASVARSVAETLIAFNHDRAFSIRLLERDVNEALTQERLLARLSGFFAALALLLSAVGLYGLAAYSVARRRLELGIRLALGATRRRIVNDVVSRIVVLVACGLVVGTGLSLWLSRFVTALLYDLTPRDPMVMGAAVAALATITALATAVPAFSAASVDPAEVLRQS